MLHLKFLAVALLTANYEIIFQVYHRKLYSVQLFRNHQSSFKLPHREFSTTLSSYVWQLKREGVNYNIKWEILVRALAYSPESKSCQLCTTEATMIANMDRGTSLNTKGEIMSKCRHKDKFLLVNFASSIQESRG